MDNVILGGKDLQFTFDEASELVNEEKISTSLSNTMKEFRLSCFFIWLKGSE